MKKGANFEREICKRLSKWISGGERDDIFWRTQGSGARATNRKRSGQSTMGQYGDVAATDDMARPFCNLFTVELKRGYQKATIGEVLDRPVGTMMSQLELWITKLRATADDAKTPFWMLIHRRNQREELVYLPRKAQKQFDREYDCFDLDMFDVSASFRILPGVVTKAVDVIAVRFEELIHHVTPGHIEHYEQRLSHREKRLKAMR